MFLGEADAEEARRHIEAGRDDLFELEVGFQLGLVESAYF